LKVSGTLFICQKLLRRLLEELDKVLRSYFAQKGAARGQRGEGTHGKGWEHVKWDMYVWRRSE